MKSPSSIPDRIMSRVRSRGRGGVFVSADFLDLGSRGAVDVALSRLAASGRMRRLAQGLYDYPRKSPSLGALSPKIDQVARALVRDGGGDKLQVDGAAAANALGLSTQVPAQAVFLTNGAGRQVKIGRQTVTLKHVSPKNLPAAGKPAGAVFQALRWLGRDGVDAKVINHLRSILGDDDKIALGRIAPAAPGWAAPVLRQIAS